MVMKGQLDSVLPRTQDRIEDHGASARSTDARNTRCGEMICLQIQCVDTNTSGPGRVVDKSGIVWLKPRETAALSPLTSSFALQLGSRQTSVEDLLSGEQWAFGRLGMDGVCKRGEGLRTMVASFDDAH